MREKKLLLCVNSDIGRKGTIGFRFTQIAKELQKNNLSFEILARANYCEDLNVKTPFYKNFLSRILNGIKIYFFPSFQNRNLDVYFFEKFALKTIKKTNQNFHLAHFGEYAHKTISYLKNNGAKVILDIPIAHPCYAHYLQNKGFVLDEKIADTPLFLKNSIELADLLIAPSFFVKETLEMAGVKKPLEIVPFGVDLPKNFSEKDIEEKIKKPLRFIFAGNVNFRKGINFLLEAWDKLNLVGTELLICGRVYKSIRAILKNFKLKNVKFLGYVNLDEYFRKANVFVFPTLFEGSAKVVYEAMSYGLPVITTLNAGSVVKEGKSGFIVPIGKSDELAEKINYFYKNPEKIIELGKNAFFEAKNYSWERYSQSLLEIYKKNML